MTSQPFISFIICTYNRADYLRDSIQSLLKSEAAAGEFEILIIDNNSKDKTPETVRKIVDAHPDLNLYYIKESKQGLSHARNRGIKEANAPFIVFLDDDICASKSLIPAWISFFKESPQAAAAGGKINVQFDDPRPRWMSHFLLPLLGYHSLGETKKKYPQNKYPFGGNMGFKKTVFDEYGLFHTELGRTGNSLKASEEKEFFQRLKRDGVKIFYLPDAILYHRVNKERLTKDYIKKQAVGLGQSIALQFQKESKIQKSAQGLQQIFKTVVTVGLFLPYTLTLQFSKARMLLKFRRWIIEGYFSISNGE